MKKSKDKVKTSPQQNEVKTDKEQYSHSLSKGKSSTPIQEPKTEKEEKSLDTPPSKVTKNFQKRESNTEKEKKSQELVLKVKTSSPKQEVKKKKKITRNSFPFPKAGR